MGFLLEGALVVVFFICRLVLWGLFILWEVGWVDRR